MFIKKLAHRVVKEITTNITGSRSPVAKLYGNIAYPHAVDFNECDMDKYTMIQHWLKETIADHEKTVLVDIVSSVYYDIFSQHAEFSIEGSIRFKNKDDAVLCALCWK